MWQTPDQLLTVFEERHKDLKREVEQARLVQVALEASRVQPCAEPAAEASRIGALWQSFTDQLLWPLARRKAPCV